MSRRGLFALGLGLLAAGLSPVGMPAARANTTDTFTATTSGASWSTATNWSLGLPTSANDVLFTGSDSASTTITATSFTIGSFNATRAEAVTNATAGTTASTLTLGGGSATTDQVDGANPADLIFVTANSSLNGGSTGALNLVLGQAGRFDAFGGTLDIGTSGTASTLNLGGFTVTVTGTSAVNIGSSISNGALTKIGSNTLTLNGSVANTYTGNTTINGGSLVLNFANLATPTDLINSGSALSLGGGTLTVTGKATGTTSQTFNGTTVNAGGGQILVTPNGGSSTTVNLGALSTTTAGGSLLVGTTPGNATTGTVAITTTSGPDATTGIYGGRVVFSSGTANTGYDWATSTSGSSPYTLSAYSGYTALNTAGGTDVLNSRITASANLAGSTTTNTLKIENPAASQILALGANLLTLTGGGLLSTGTNATTISGTAGATRLTAGNGSGSYDLIVSQFNSGGLTISAVIGDNGANAVSLVKAGSQTLTLSGANTYSGGTSLNSGTIALGASSTPTSGTVTSGPLGTGTLTLNGGTLQRASGAGTITIANAISVGNGAASISSAGGTSGNNLVLNGNISGSGYVNVAGVYNASGLLLAGNNSSFTGTITVNGGNTRLDSANAGSSSAAWVLTGGGLSTDVAGANTFNFGSLAGTSGQIGGHYGQTTAGTLQTLSVGALNTSTTYAGSIVDNVTTTGSFNNVDSAANNVLTLTKVGTGTLTLSAITSSFTGDVTINAGTVAANGANGAAPTTSGLGALQPTANRNFTVNNGGTLAFTGGNVLGTGGSTNPLTNNTLVVNAGGVFTTGSATAVAANGFWNKIGAVTLNGGTINVGTGANATTFQGLALIGTVTVGGSSTTPSTIQNISGTISNGVHLGQNNTANQVIIFNVADVTGDATSDLNVSTPLLNTSSTLTASGLTKTGAGTMTLTGANTYSGGTTISSGTLATGTTGGTLGTGNVTITTGALTLQNSASFGDTATLTFMSGSSTINLNFTGTDTLGGITNGTLSEGAGTYSATDLNTFFGGSSFSGTGFLNVVPVPEPATWFAGAMLVGAVGWRKRRSLRALVDFRAAKAA